MVDIVKYIKERKGKKNMSVSILKARRRRCVAPLWHQYDMEVLQKLLDRYHKLAKNGIRALGGKYPPPTFYAE